MIEILIVEDDNALSQGIALSLRDNDRRLTQCPTLAAAREAMAGFSYDLLILDIGLPDGDGLNFCREVRRSSDVPILFLTANDAEYDEVAGLEAGGDDYITKPFSLAILRARVEAILRRQEKHGAEVVSIANMTFDFNALIYTKNGRELILSKTEQRLLRLLVQNPGQTLTRDLLLDKVWDGGEFVDENTLSVAIRRLRTKLEDDPKKPRYIQTVYGIGYRWKETE